jgi:hypothetical protein
MATAIYDLLTRVRPSGPISEEDYILTVSFGFGPLIILDIFTLYL